MFYVCLDIKILPKETAGTLEILLEQRKQQQQIQNSKEIPVTLYPPYINISSIDIIEVSIDEISGVSHNRLTITAPNEAEVLQRFSEYLQNVQSQRKIPTFVTFRGLSWDIPVLIYKAIKHNVTLHSRFLDTNKWRSTAHIDLYQTLTSNSFLPITLDEAFVDFFPSYAEKVFDISSVEKVFLLFLRIQGYA